MPCFAFASSRFPHGQTAFEGIAISDAAHGILAWSTMRCARWHNATSRYCEVKLDFRGGGATEVKPTILSARQVCDMVGDCEKAEGP
jgi:hypothetical protein